MSKEKEGGLSLGVALSFVFLFFIFLILKNPKTTGLATLPTGAAIGGGSKITVVVITLVLILALGISFFFFMRMRHKKKGLPIKPGKKSLELSEEQIEKLFSEEKIPQIKSKTMIELSPEKTKKEAVPAKPVTNLTELRKEIQTLIEKGMSGQEILNSLSKKYPGEQIEKAVNEINYERLKLYVQRTLNQGFDRERIKKALLSKNWPEDQISRAFNEPESKSIKPTKPIKQKPGTEKKETEELDLDLI